jgi:hypothetical protein
MVEQVRIGLLGGLSRTGRPISLRERESCGPCPAFERAATRRAWRRELAVAGDEAQYFRREGKRGERTVRGVTNAPEDFLLLVLTRPSASPRTWNDACIRTNGL